MRYCHPYYDLSLSLRQQALRHMIPGMNPRMMKQAMKKMGMEQEDLEATEVIIKTADKELVFTSPGVAKVTVMGQESWQITGEYQERSLDSTPEISEDDVRTVMEQAGVSEEKAREAIAEAKGDLAAAILQLSE